MLRHYAITCNKGLHIANIPLQYIIDAMGSCTTISASIGNCTNENNAMRKYTIAVLFIVLLTHSSCHITNYANSSYRNLGI